MSSVRLAALAFATLAAAATGCAPKIAIRTLEPGPVSLGPARQLSILHSEGRRSAREVVCQQLINQCRSRGFFTVVDRSEEGLFVRVAGRRVVIDGGHDVLESDAAGMRLDVLEWNAYRETECVTHTDPQGNEYTEDVRVQRGNVLLAVTLFNADGRTFLSEAEYEGGFTTTDMEVPRDEVIENAASDAVARLVSDISPRPVVSHVVLDADDPGQETIIATAKAGNVAQAAEDARRYLDRNPNNAAAAYNLAVFLEAMGQYREALEAYDRALSLGNKPFYSQARAGCARRLAATEALSGAGG